MKNVSLTKLLSIVCFLFVSVAEGQTETSSGEFVFSVSKTQKVYFSPGNLQWTAKGSHMTADGNIIAGTWRFAPRQWDTVGINNGNVNANYTGWIDLFGWGTSGYKQKYPYMTSLSSADYGDNETNIAATCYDWGVYNAIVNPRTQTTDAPGTWRTLTKEEWIYLLETRDTPSGVRFAKSTVNGVPGLLIVPDNWNTSAFLLFNTNIYTAVYASNIITSDEWMKLDSAGCVFLPAAGERNGTSVNSVGNRGSYWSASCYSCLYSHLLFFNLSYLGTSNFCARFSCNAVRLVKDTQ
ncbi:MAG: hypothetical protein J5701_01595 [Bacteroidales bacterium]|nr:hypothetical protein [Bacteroidales bacterium]